MSLKSGDFYFVARNIAAFNIIMIQMFLYCYVGETLSLKTQAISRAIYSSKWYDLPTSIVRDIYFIIARANKPVRMKVGNFYIIDFDSFKNILKISISYFSVLQIMLVR